MTTGRGGHYRIEWDVSWNPKRSEQDCYAYIESRYPEAVYGAWEKSPFVDVDWNPMPEDGKHMAEKKPCYATPSDKKRNNPICWIFRQGVMNRFGQVNWERAPTQREKRAGMMDVEE